MNYQLIATQLGDLLKYDMSVNEINKIARAIFNFEASSFPNDSITSVRAQRIYDWIMTLTAKKMNNEERHMLLVRFCRELAGDQYVDQVVKILENNGIPYNIVYKDELSAFVNREFHDEIHKHSSSGLTVDSSSRYHAAPRTRMNQGVSMGRRFFWAKSVVPRRFVKHL